MVKVFKSGAAKAQVLRSYDGLLAGWGTAYQELDVQTPRRESRAAGAGEP